MSGAPICQVTLPTPVITFAPDIEMSPASVRQHTNNSAFHGRFGNVHRNIDIQTCWASQSVKRVSVLPTAYWTTSIVAPLIRKCGREMDKRHSRCAQIIQLPDVSHCKAFARQLRSYQDKRNSIVTVHQGRKSCLLISICYCIWTN